MRERESQRETEREREGVRETEREREGKKERTHTGAPFHCADIQTTSHLTFQSGPDLLWGLTS